MKKNLFFIGLDIAEADFAASIYKTPSQSIITKEAIPNDPKGSRDAPLMAERPSH